MPQAPLYGSGSDRASSNMRFPVLGMGDDPYMGRTPGTNQFTDSFAPGGMPGMFTPGNTDYFGGGGTSPMYGSNPPGQNGYFGSGYNPYQVPGSGGYFGPGYGQGTNPLPLGANTGPPGPSHNLGHGIIATGLQYPGLSANFANYINSQIGQGLTPFDLSTVLPTGGMTQPGQLTAGLNPLLSQLQNFFMGGSTNVPGLNTLGTIASQGVSALPEWQAMIKAQQQNNQQSQANIAEQFASMGDLAGSPYGTSLGNFESQLTANQNALLGQLQQSNIQNIQMPAIESLFQGSQQFGSGLQALDQQAIQNMYNEFQRVQPQNNPLLQYMMGLSTLYPPTTRTPTTWENINSTLGALQGSGFSMNPANQGGGLGGINF